MRRVLLGCVLFAILIVPVNAAEFTAPTVPKSGEAFFPYEQEDFSAGLWSIITEAMASFMPSFFDAAQSGARIIAMVLLFVVVKNMCGGSVKVVELATTIAIAGLLLEPSNMMIRMGAETIKELHEYSKLLMPVLTTAMAAQGGITTSSALYMGTMALDTFLSSVVNTLLVPMVYVYLCISTASCAIGEEMLKRLNGTIKSAMTWLLKTVLYVFTGFMGITGVVSGSADAAALKATKLTISGAVPVVGSILSDASEAILVGTGIMKSTIGVYGVLAILAIWIGPFVKIGAQYILMKGVCALTEMLNAKQAGELMNHFSSAMGLLLAMTSTVCLLLLISVICFMKGIN